MLASRLLKTNIIILKRGGEEEKASEEAREGKEGARCRGRSRRWWPA